MRKRITRTLLAAVALCAALSAEAYDFEADGIYYNITSETDKTVEVTWGDSYYSGDITIPATVTNSGTTYTVTSIGESAFESCESLTSIGIPDGVMSIGRTAFLFCTNLTSITIPEGVTEIGDYAFDSCVRLAEINCFATVPPVCGKDCFSGVDKENCTLNVPEGAESAYKNSEIWNEFFYEGYFVLNGIKYAITSSVSRTVEVIVGDNLYTGNIEIPATVSFGGTIYTVTSIGASAFGGNVSLVSINLPNSVTSIGEGAFSYCEGLTSINIPAGVTKIKDATFFGCAGLASINIPAGVTEIGEDAFYICTSLTSVNIPDGVTKIGGYAFAECSNLTTVTLGSGLETIGEGAFFNCSSLTSITIPDRVTVIGDKAFYNCSNITSINIPDEVTSIGESAFFYCSSLSEIYSLATVPPVCDYWCFLGVDTYNCTLYVPEGTADAYKVAEWWKDFFNIVETDFSGSEEIAADAAAEAKVYAAAGRIVVENAAAGTPIAVYSADGVQIYGGVVSDTFTEIPVPAGKLYIVKCGNAVFKTVM